MSEHVKVAVIGAGLGGLCAAIKLKEAGCADLAILEKNPRVGGVWHENVYPGCACDVPIALYQLSFAQSANWSHLFPRSAEVQAYADELTHRYGLRPHLRLGDGVKQAVWQEETSRWAIETESGRSLTADIMIAGMGQLNRPAWPGIRGLDTFAGAKVHSARWDRNLDLRGKRVGVIGAAASAVQLIPEVAQVAERVAVFQRTPNWVVPRNDRAITPEEKALMMTAPEIAADMGERNRRILHDNADHFFWQAFSWTQAGRDAFTRQALDHLEAQVPDPVLRAKLTPDYPIGCKRVLFSDDYYPSLLRGNVELVVEGIAAIDAAGLTTQDGRRHELDAIVCATGFETTQWRWSMDAIGLSGIALHDQWAQTPQAYLGVTVHNFPNMFVLYGPNTNLGHNSILIMLEQQAEYIVRAIAALDKSNAAAMMPRKAAQDRFNDELRRDLQGTVWADPNCTSWYKNAEGMITQNWSSHTRDYAAALSEFAAGDYAFIE